MKRFFFSGIAVVAALAHAETPAIYWASSPVRAGETVLITGEGLEGAENVRLCAEGKAPLDVKPHTVTKDCVMAEIPAGMDAGDLLCSVGRGKEFSNSLPVNAPEVWWWSGDNCGSVTPGNAVRLFGKSLGKGLEAKLTVAGKEAALAADRARLDDASYPVPEKGCLAEKTWDARFLVPSDVPEGEWPLSVRLPGKVWHGAGKVVVKRTAPWPSATVDFAAMQGKNNDDKLASAFAALASSGGGTVSFPRGRFNFDKAIHMPRRTVLRGAGMGMTTIYWDKRETKDIPNESFVTGGDFGAEDIAFCAYRNNGMIRSQESDGFFLRRVRIRASGFFRMGYPGEKRFRGGSDTPAEEDGSCAVTIVRGRNFEVSGCDIYCSGKGVEGVNVADGRIRGNTVRFGSNGYVFHSLHGLVFEGNDFEGASLTAMECYFGAANGARATDIWCSRNRFHFVMGRDMELMTTDCVGSAYAGGAASAVGETLTLAAAPYFQDYQEDWIRTHGGGAGHGDTNWPGGLVSVLAGKGAGQWRQVTQSSTGRVWKINQPWVVPPDSSSLLGICSMMGRNLFVDNSFEDGGAVQLFKAGTETVFAGNRLTRTYGFDILGGSAWSGYGPSWYCQLFDNAIVEGNCWGSWGGELSVHTGAPLKSRAVAMCRGIIVRRTRLEGNAHFSFEGGRNGSYTADSLIEGCSVENSDYGIRVEDTCKNIVQRKNAFRNVEKEWEVFKR